MLVLQRLKEVDEMVFRKDEKRPELDIMVFVRVKIYVEQNWNFSNGSSAQERPSLWLHNYSVRAGTPAYEQHWPLNVVRQALTNVARTYHAVSSDIEKLHVEPKDEH
jgi:hypothetical protein